MSRFLIFLVAAVLLVTGCENHDQAAADELLEGYGTTGGLYETKNEIYSNDGKSLEYLELRIDSIPRFHKYSIPENMAASFSALQLYKRISQESIEEYNGINIVLDTNELWSFFPKYYYSMSDLEDAVRCYECVDDLLIQLRAHRFIESEPFLDTTASKLTASQFLEKSEQLLVKLDSTTEDKGDGTQGLNFGLWHFKLDSCSNAKTSTDELYLITSMWLVDGNYETNSFVVNRKRPDCKMFVDIIYD